MSEQAVRWETLTPCGECCMGCAKKKDGFCRGCIESDGHCKEWEQSGGCPIFRCAKAHSVSFCGLCPDFPCGWLRETVTWNPHIAAHLSALAEEYKKQNG